jgi:hypothetical protein
VLIAASRFPWPAHSGDRLRTVIWLEALREHDVTLIAPPGDMPAGIEHVEYVALRPSMPLLVARCRQALLERLPRQSLLAAVYDWERAIAEASGDEPFDAAIVLLSRCDPWLRGRLPATRTILDAVDAMSVSAVERSRAGSFPGAPFWERERARSERFEATASGAWDAVVTVSEAERGLFGAGAAVIPNGVEIQPETAGERPFDFAFWGNLPYFANRDAIQLLLREVWPAIRQRVPSASLLIAGSDASPSLVRRHGHDGITVVSPMEDRANVLRRVKIALVPLRYGSGVSNKMLEAAEASCALAGTPLAFRGLSDLAEGQIVESDSSRLADECVALLTANEWLRRGTLARSAVIAAHDRTTTRERLLALTSPRLRVSA